DHLGAEGLARLRTLAKSGRGAEKLAGEIRGPQIERCQVAGAGGHRLTTVPHRTADRLRRGPIPTPELDLFLLTGRHSAIDARVAEGGDDLSQTAAELRGGNGGGGDARQANGRALCLWPLRIAFAGKQ